MGSGFSIRARRRTAAQQLALLQVKREISATDPHGRLKYVRDFSEAFRDYRRALNDTEFKQQCSTADVLLVGDYHALAASQDFAASLHWTTWRRATARWCWRWRWLSAATNMCSTNGCAAKSVKTNFAPAYAMTPNGDMTGSRSPVCCARPGNMAVRFTALI